MKNENNENNLDQEESNINNQYHTDEELSENDNQNDNQNKKQNEYQDNDINNDNDIYIDYEEINEDGLIDYKSMIKKLKDKIKSLEKEKQDNLNGWMRAQADYKNREIQIDKDKKEWGDIAVKRFVEDLLIVLDTYDSARANKAVWESVDNNWRSGIEYMFNIFENKLSEKGFEKFSKVGDIFDPNIHEGLGIDHTEDKDNIDKISQIIMSGYKYKGNIYRPAKVKIWGEK